MNKLFMVYMGGSAAGAHIELHDIRFVVGANIEATYGQLKRQWFGDKNSAHMDSYVHVHHVDGYKIKLQQSPPEQHKTLYFVNFGGYFPGRMAEFHDFTLVVAQSADEAKLQAKKLVKVAGLADCEQLHTDDLLEVDNCLQLDLIDGYYIHLVPDGGQQTLEPDWMGYQPL
ncbi:DUF1543 domain-containing protein [Aliidiomarina maris]|uniref:Uncharacterized protein DUF1543 n=2 Tax=Aliidiomarina maris TaxID=531312 RepID=A0A327X390_9GAMM|nr:DUF1543 domain-containing protein [Aliidiomarina maris]RAK01570.1 uncharacterized protein DUF1543 [Aliidiomarina maris]